MRRNHLPVIASDCTPLSSASHMPVTLGVLSIHLVGGRCRVGCPFCYMADRQGADLQAPGEGELDLTPLREALRDRLRPSEIAVAVNEPVEAALPALAEIAALCQGARAPLTVTTTLAGAAALPDEALRPVGRLNLSVDPFKGRVQAADVAQAVSALRARPGPWAGEVVLLVSLSTQRFAQALVGGLLAELLATEGVDRVALNGLKPPPAWCDRAFWLRALAGLGPLLRRELNRRLFLDCYVSARILGIGGCPARPDLSPGPGPGQLAFRSCVYQPAPDFVVRSGQELGDRLTGFTPPEVCPFTIK